ncbi:MAG: ADP-ribosylglycohydrolase family protein [Bacteroidales bacterium]|nr:ADP-ribosylglycohydrolase family protein [Bacteroidales bacterium]
MLGAIIGDTIGSVYEFHNIKTTHFPLFDPRSNYTDDSIMTMAVANWLLTDPQHGMDTLETSFLNFAQKYPCPMGGYGPGFYRWLFEPETFVEGKRHPYHSFGNGAAMRCSANGWMFDTLEETERVAGLSAAITHSHPEGIKGAQSTAAAIFMARNGKSKEEIRNYISTKYGYNLNRTCEEIRPVYDWDSSCQGTVPEAMVAFLDSTDFESAIRLAVSLGGDSDTLACITGGIAEAFYKNIPDSIALKIWELIPEDFKAIFRAMETQTSYCLPNILKEQK